MAGFFTSTTWQRPDGTGFWHPSGNTIHVMQVGSDGTVTELNAAAPTAIPVPKGTNPQGIAVITAGA